MICTKCNAEIPDGSRFCRECGTLLQSPFAAPSASRATNQVTDRTIIAESSTVHPAFAQTSMPKQRIGNAKLLIILAVLGFGFVIFIAFMVVVGAFAMQQSVVNEQQSQTLTVNEEDTPYLVIPGEEATLIYYGSQEPASVPGEYYMHLSANEGHTIAVFVRGEDAATYDLYLSTGRKTVLIDEKIANAELAPSGKALVYLTENSSNAPLCTLHYYDIETGKSRALSYEAASDMAYVVISPDGDAVAFADKAEYGDGNTLDSFTGALSRNGAEATVIGKNHLPVAVSDKGEIVYYVEYSPDSSWDYDLYVQTQKDAVELGSLDQDSQIYLNMDNTEICFSSLGGTCIARDGEKTRSFSMDEMTDIVFPSYTDMYPASLDDRFVTAMIPSLTDNIFVFDDFGQKIEHVNHQFVRREFEKDLEIAEKEAVFVSSDSTSFTCVNVWGDLVTYDDFHNMFTTPKKNDCKVNIKQIYYRDPWTILILDEDNTLYMVKDDGKPMQVATKVIESSVQFLPEGQSVYYMTGNTSATQETAEKTLWVASTVAPEKSYKVAEAVMTYEASAYGVVYYTYIGTSSAGSYTAQCEAFYAKDGRNFKSVSGTAIVRYE